MAYRLLSVMFAIVLIFSVGSVAMAQEADIVDTAAANEDFSTLVAAVQAAGLVDALKGEGPFTVFAPVNAAFQPLADDGTLDALLADPTGPLQDILLYHVVAGKVMSTDLSDGLEAETLLPGAKLVFSVSEAGVMVNGVNVVTADIEVANGVIHVIDGVLVPAAEGEMAEEAEGEMAEEAEGEMAEEAEGDMAVEAAAPSTMPATGAAQTSLPLPLAVAAAFLAVIGAAVIIRRR